MNTGGSGDARIAPMLVGAVRSGSIVVLHEGTDRRHGVVATTDRLLAELGRRGLTAVSVSTMVAMAR